MRFRLFLFSVLAGCLPAQEVFPQCCAGGSGSPIAGGTSQGVLMQGQMELNTNFQFIYSDQFYTGDVKDTLKYFNDYRSTYEYFRVAYGVTKNLTMSVESGYFFNKKETGLDYNPLATYESSGLGDLILFPRYDIINHTKESRKSELTFGMGMKIPLGSYNDSSGFVEPYSGQTFYITNPQGIQMSTGAQDVFFYLFGYRGNTTKRVSFFFSSMYIIKGWNPVGERMGDYGHLALFASTRLTRSFGLTLQVRGEVLGKMKLNETVLLYSYPNYDPEATGYRKIFFSPQLNFSKGNFTFYALTDIPIYQHVEKTQLGSQHMSTLGISYRFMLSKANCEVPESEAYSCPMHPEIQSNRKTTCSKCGMDLVKK